MTIAFYKNTRTRWIASTSQNMLTVSKLMYVNSQQIFTGKLFNDVNTCFTYRTIIVSGKSIFLLPRCNVSVAPNNRTATQSGAALIPWMPRAKPALSILKHCVYLIVTVSDIKRTRTMSKIKCIIHMTVYRTLEFNHFQVLLNIIMSYKSTKRTG